MFGQEGHKRIEIVVEDPAFAAELDEEGVSPCAGSEDAASTKAHT